MQCSHWSLLRIWQASAFQDYHVTARNSTGSASLINTTQDCKARLANSTENRPVWDKAFVAEGDLELGAVRILTVGNHLERTEPSTQLVYNRVLRKEVPVDRLASRAVLSDQITRFEKLVLNDSVDLALSIIEAVSILALAFFASAELLEVFCQKRVSRIQIDFKSADRNAFDLNVKKNCRM